jgi:hypothetical protein
MGYCYRTSFSNGFYAFLALKKTSHAQLLSLHCSWPIIIIIYFIIGGVGLTSKSLGTTATSGLLYKPQMIGEYDWTNYIPPFPVPFQNIKILRAHAHRTRKAKQFDPEYGGSMYLWNISNIYKLQHPKN